MTSFIPREKLSKKEKRKLDQSRRQTWGKTNPVTRRTENKKAYRRTKPSRWMDEYSMRAFHFCA